MRIEPAPSVPRCRTPRLSSAAAAAPPDEPPVVRSWCHGLRVMPVSGEWQTPIQPHSGSVVLPRNTAPCSRRRATAGASAGAGVSLVVSEPLRDGKSGDVDVVLDRRRQAVERDRAAHPSSSALRTRAPGQRAIRIDVHEGVDAPARTARCARARRARHRPARARAGRKGEAARLHSVEICRLAMIPAVQKGRGA